MSGPEKQLARAVLMIRPVAFRSNPQTADSNQFQRDPGVVDPLLEQRAAAVQFQGLVDTIRAAGIGVVVEPDLPTPETPDSIFPNNWVSFHADGTVVIYPMMAPNRRAEVRPDIIERLDRERGYRVDRVVDMTGHTVAGQYLEGTGSLVLDRRNRIAYAALSPRTTRAALADFGQKMDYEIIAFEALDRDGQEIYHTNVMMSLGEGFAVICYETIPDRSQRQAVLLRLDGAEQAEAADDLAAVIAEARGDEVRLIKVVIGEALGPGEELFAAGHGVQTGQGLELLAVDFHVRRRDLPVGRINARVFPEIFLYRLHSVEPFVLAGCLDDLQCPQDAIGVIGVQPVGAFGIQPAEALV